MVLGGSSPPTHEGRRALGIPICWSSGILLCTGVYLAMGLLALAAWGVSGNLAWVEDFFRIPGTLLLVWLASVECWLSMRAWRQFAPGEPLRRVWLLMAGASGCGLLGSLQVQVLSARSGLNPLLHVDGWWSESIALSLRQAGQTLGGPIRFALLAAAVWWALKIYRRAGFLGRLNWLNFICLAAVGLYVGLEAFDLSAALRAGKRPGLAEMMNWPTDPLLWLLLAEAMLLLRSVDEMGPGMIGRTWKALSVAVFLTSLGDFSLWATNYGYLPWPWSSITWYIWLPAAAAFAMAPAYQLEVVQRATLAAVRENHVS
jgi:hypothetical protein